MLSGEVRGEGKRLTRWEAKILRFHVFGPWGYHCRTVMSVVEAQMLQAHSVFPKWLWFAERKGRQKPRGSGRLAHLRQNLLGGREELAKEPLRSLRSLWDITERGKLQLELLTGSEEGRAGSRTLERLLENSRPRDRSSGKISQCTWAAPGGYAV